MTQSDAASGLRVGSNFYQSHVAREQFLLRDERMAEAVSWDHLAQYVTTLSVAGELDETEGTLGRGRTLLENYAGVSCVVRMYRRGGMMRHLLRNRFLLSPLSSLAHSRPLQEFCYTAVLHNAGCAVPRPVAVAVRRYWQLWWSGVLITELRPGDNLLALIRTGLAAPQIEEVARVAGRAAGEILKVGICHGDLHLGNVLWSNTGGVTLIDFDKAGVVRDSLEIYRAKLIERWQRSVQKHGLGLGVVEAFKSGLSEGSAV